MCAWVYEDEDDHDHVDDNHHASSHSHRDNNDTCTNAYG